MRLNWPTRTSAAEVGIGDSSVLRLWAANGLKPNFVESSTRMIQALDPLWRAACLKLTVPSLRLRVNVAGKKQQLPLPGVALTSR
jgi:hypothetical protein